MPHCNDTRCMKTTQHDGDVRTCNCSCDTCDAPVAPTRKRQSVDDSRDTPTQAPRAGRAMAVIAMSSVVTAAVALVSFVAAWRVVRPAEWVDINAIDHACRADVVAAECMLTNKTSEPVKTCFVVHIERASGKRMRVSTINICPGRLDAFESRTVRAPWHASIAATCSDSEGRLDYDACVLAVEAGGH